MHFREVWVSSKKDFVILVFVCTTSCKWTLILEAFIYWTTSINKESIIDIEGEVKAAAQKVQSCSQEDVEILVGKVKTLLCVKFWMLQKHSHGLDLKSWCVVIEKPFILYRFLW